MKRIVGALATVLAIVGYALLLWKGPWWVDGAHLRTKNLQPADGVVITGFRTMLVAMGAGAVAALGLYYTHKGHKQTEALFEHTRGKDREQAELTREGQVTERYVEAIKLLSSENPTQQLGGIYALERIMRDSSKDRTTIVFVLEAFVRQHAPQRDYDPDSHPGRPSDAVQAALTVLARRPTPEADAAGLDLRHTDLIGANLRGGHLDDSDFTGAWLMKVDLSDAELRGAFFVDAKLTDADLAGCDAQYAKFVGADASGVAFHQADLSGAVFSHAQVQGANFNGAKLRRASFYLSQGLEPRQLGNACLDSTTSLPDGMKEERIITARIEAVEKGKRASSRS